MPPTNYIHAAVLFIDPNSTYTKSRAVIQDIIYQLFPPCMYDPPTVCMGHGLCVLCKKKKDDSSKTRICSQCARTCRHPMPVIQVDDLSQINSKGCAMCDSPSFVCTSGVPSPALVNVIQVKANETQCNSVSLNAARHSILLCGCLPT